MRHIIILWHILLFPLLGYSQVCGLEDTTRVRRATSVGIPIEVLPGDLVNDDLSDPNQGLCAIEIDFIHGFVEDFELTLTSPSGQSVQLTGPTTTSLPGSPTFISRWQISFVASSIPAEPDPGFVAQWDNDLMNFTAGFPYNGSYYPYDGNLEDFNSGTVSGTWTLTANNLVAFNDGAIYGVRLIFCDQTGLDCCFADAGEFQNNRLLFCEGDVQLDYIPDISGLSPLDPNLFGYTYLVSQDDVLLYYDSDGVDLSGAVPGTYQVCGLSYLLSDASLLPQADGQNTLTGLYEDLYSLAPTFCGELTENCQQLTIQSPPTPVDTLVQICEGETFVFFDSSYTESGTYPYTLRTAGGCDQLFNIFLSVIPARINNLDMTICEGEAVQIGNTLYNTTGNYRDTLVAASGCDSIIVLDLEVIPAIPTNLNETICRGESVVVGNQSFFNSGSYVITLPSALNCDSTINLNLTVLDPVINLRPADTLTCARTSVTLNAANSTPVGLLDFEWQDAMGNTLGVGSTLSVDQPGDYVLFATQGDPGAGCTVRETITVPESEAFPVADAGLPQALTCETETITLGGSGTSLGNQYAYSWTTDTGNFLDPQNIPAPIVNAPGRYELVVTNISSSCTDTSVVNIGLDQTVPTVISLPDTSLNCNYPTILLTSDGSSQGAVFANEWRNSNGDLLSTAADLSVNRADSYELLIRNTTNGCWNSTTINVGIDTLLPEITAVDAAALDCEQTTVRLNADTLGADPDVTINWAVSNGGSIIQDANSLSPLIDAGGTYTLTLTNLRNGCETSAGVTVADNRNLQSAQPAPPDILGCNTNSIILNAGTSSSGPNVIYLWSTLDGAFTGDAVGPTVEVNAPGTYTLTVLDTISNCTDEAAVTVERDLNSPRVEAGSGFTINCQTQMDTLLGTGSSVGSDFIYNWTGPCLQSDPDALWVIADCAGIYYLEVTNTNNNCSAVDSVEVLLDQSLPTAIVQPVDTLSCVLPAVSLDATASTPANNLQFNWTGPGISGTAMDPSIAVDLPGAYQLTVTNPVNFCSDILTVDVFNDTEAPMADAGPKIDLTCENPTGQIGGSNTSIGPFYTYQWVEVEGQLPAVKDAPFVAVDQEGIYRLIVTDTRNSCRDSSMVVVVEDKELPGVDAGPDREITCGAELVELDGTNSVQGADIAYQWSGPCLLGPTDDLVTTADCPGVYRLTVTDTITGCSAVDSVMVTLNSTAPIIALADTAFINCTDGTAVLDGSASSNGFFEWTKDGELIADGTDLITVDEIGVYLLSISNQNTGCVATDSIRVLENCQPEINIKPTDDIDCQDPTVIIDAGDSEGQSLNYEWIVPDPACIVTGQGTSVIEVSCGGDYTLVLTNTALMLRDTQTVTVAIDNNLPLAVLGPPDTLTCVQTEVLLDGSGSSSGPNIIYRWTRASTGALIAETASTTTENPGTFTLEVIDTTSQCSASATIRIVEFNLPIGLSFGDSTLACGQDTFALTAFPTPLSDFYTYDWSGPEILDQADRPTVLLGEPGTYSLLVTDQRSECQASASVTLSEDQQCTPCVEIAVPDTIDCDQPTVDLEASFCHTCAGCVLQWTTPDGSIIANGNTLIPTVSQAGTYRLTVINPQGLQTEVETEVFNNGVLPEAAAGPDRLLTCDSTSVRLGAVDFIPQSNVVYSWNAVDNPTFPATEGTNITVTAPGTYALEARDTLTGCIGRDTALVTYDTLTPIAEAGLDRMLNCKESFVILDAGDSSSGNDMVYTWSSSESENCLQGINTVNPIVTCAGTYYLQVKNENTGCFARDSVVVTSSEDVPILTPLPDTAFICGRDSIELLGNIPAPAGFSFNWCTLDSTGQPIPNTCVSDLSLMVGTPGAYQFSVTDEVTGCEASFIVSVSDERTLPIVDAGSDLTFRCSDDSLRINATAGPDTSLLDIQWISLNDYTLNDANTLTPVVYGADTLILIATNRQTTCSVQDTLIITQNLGIPTVEAGPDTALTCLQPTLRLSGSGASNGGNTISYQWTTTDGNIQMDANTSTPLIDRPGTYLLTVSDEENTCMATDEVIVRDARQAPEAAIDGLDTLQFSCAADVLMLDASPSVSASSGGLNYLWSIVTTGNLIGDPTQSTIQTDAVGNYQLIVTDQLTGCRDSLPFTLSATIDIPDIRILTPEELTCERTAVILDATDSEYGPAYSATWFDDQGEVVLLDDLELTVTEPGTYTLQIENNQSGCSNTSEPMIVAGNTVLPTVSIAPADLLDCSINSVTLDGSASSNGSTFQYQWTTADGMLIDGANQLQAAAGAPGTYQLQVFNTQNGCSETASILVEAITIPIAGIQVEITAPGCSNDAGGSILVNEVFGGTPPFTFSLNGGAALSTGIFNQLRAGTYTLSIRDTNGCEWEEGIIVPAALPIDIDLGLDLTISSGDSVRLEAQTSSSDIVNYQWDPAIASGPTAVVAPQISTSYSLTVTDSNGCSASDRVRIIVEKNQAYFIPNVFSPDGNGNNDRFVIMAGPEVVNIPVFRIYDRWGQLVYEQQNIPPNDPQLGWDGRYNGSLMNAAVFVFFVELEYNDGRIEYVKGDVTLLR